MVIKFFIAALALMMTTSCVTRDFFEYEKVEELNINEEFNKVVEVKVLEPKNEPAVKEITKSRVAVESVKPKGKKAAKAKANADKKREQAKKDKIKKVVKKLEKRLPKIEDSKGFIGRRPEVDPYRVGEKVTLSLNYFNMSAGDMTLEVLPFVEVNGRKSYHFQIGVKSSKVFSYFYSVEDSGETFVDYETLTPTSYSMHVKESKQLKEIRSYFDNDKLKAKYWEKKVSKDKGEENKKKDWDIKKFSQNVVSILFYLRNFTLDDGKNLAIHVADAGKNMVFTGKVVRREKLKTDLGEFDTVVLKPKIEIDGVFKQMGDIFIWLTDDDRKIPIRIEAKIKIGTLVGKLKKLQK